MRDADPTSVKSSRDAGDGLAGKPLVALRDEYHYWLFDDFLPFLDAHVIDHDLGGFLCHARPDGTRVSADKHPCYDGRGVWVHAFLYRHFEPDPRFLTTARKTAALLLKTQPHDESLWPSQYTRDGVPLRPPDRFLYNDAFVAEGFQELAKVTGESVWWERAKELLLKCERIYDRADYHPEMARVDYYLGPGASTLTGPRCVGEWMVLFQVAAQMLEFRADAEVEALRDRCIAAVFDDHYNAERDLVDELLEHDGSRTTSEASELVYPGHVCQIMWLFMHEAVRSGDAALFERSQRVFLRHLEISRDVVYGGVFQCLQHVERNVWLTDKPLWAQVEPLVGLLSVVEHTGDDRARDLFGDLYSYVLQTFPQAPQGNRLWSLHADRRGRHLPNPTRIENYHHPRHLMLNLLSLDRMIARQGAGPSGAG
jgi:mannose/cellobiose epimerase-like protein (N-acyl-D-glucosamine 2-epimerase family)